MKKTIIFLVIIIMITFGFIGCDNDPAASGGGAVVYSLGDIGPAGGHIFYINLNADTDGWTYMEAAPANFDTGVEWGNGTVTGETGTAIGTGRANTATIVISLGAGSYAAQLCDELTWGGYSDWFLPSKDELNAMYVNLFQQGLYGFFWGYYWSSSEYSEYTSQAWGQHFNTPSQYNGDQNYEYKYQVAQVRAVRAF